MPDGTPAMLKGSVAFGRIPRLTWRQSQVCWLILHGDCHKEIAERLRIRERTVRAHATCVYRRFGVPGKVALLAEFCADFPEFWTL
jgi:DNA-binding NarL/FixJ family response regulator